MTVTRMALAICASLLALAGCGGGGDARPETVVKTVVEQAPVPTQTAPADAVATATATATAPAQPAATPVANLPAGAIAVQGRFEMQVVETHGSYLGLDEPYLEHRTWFAKMTCEQTCAVQLRREIESGGFETETLDQVDGDPRKYAISRRVHKDYCNPPNGNPATRRISLHVAAVEDVAGQPTAKQLGAFQVVKQRCGDSKSSVAYRGRRTG